MCRSGDVEEAFRSISGSSVYDVLSDAGRGRANKVILDADKKSLLNQYVPFNPVAEEFGVE